MPDREMVFPKASKKAKSIQNALDRRFKRKVIYLKDKIATEVS